MIKNSVLGLGLISVAPVIVTSLITYQLLWPERIHTQVTGDLNFNYNHPNSDTLIIVVPGYRCDWKFIYQRYLKPLTNQYDVSSLTFSGTGDSPIQAPYGLGDRESLELKQFISKIIQHYPKQESIILLGISTGAVASIYALQEMLPSNEIKGLITEGGFSNNQVIYQHFFTKNHWPLDNYWGNLSQTLGQLYLHPNYNSPLIAAQHIHIPWLLIHGTQDNVVPFNSASEFKKAVPAIQLYPVIGARHTSSKTKSPLQVAGKTYWKKIDDFCRQVIQKH
jgi:pimeloyl-ACP methyl ester carboxylesterase